MQQISYCRQTIELPIANEKFFTCSAPKQDFFPVVVPREEFGLNSNLEIPAMARGCTVGGLRLSWNFAIVGSQFWATDADDLGINNVLDQIDIRAGLVVLPLALDSFAQPSSEIPPSIFEPRASQTEDSSAVSGGYFRPRVLYRCINQLWWVGRDLGGEINTNPGTWIPSSRQLDSKFSTIEDGQEGTHPVRIPVKCTLGVNEGLFWVVETNFGFAGGEGSTGSIAYGFNMLGVAAVKPARTNR